MNTLIERMTERRAALANRDLSDNAIAALSVDQELDLLQLAGDRSPGLTATKAAVLSLSGWLAAGPAYASQGEWSLLLSLLADLMP